LTVILTGCWDIGTGEKVGMITKLAQQGTWGCNTWEAEIVRGGFSGGNGVNGTKFDFTIEDPSLLPVVRHAMETQQEVKIHYHSENFTVCRSESGDHFLNSIEPIGQSQQTTQVSTAEVAPVSQATKSGVAVLDRQKTADQIIQSNKEILRQNQELIDLLKK
jgi:hypothetical protein